MTDIRINEALWAAAMAPEGLLDCWFIDDGRPVESGKKVAEVLIEGARHEIIAPAAGVLRWTALPSEVIEPGDVIGHIEDGPSNV